MKTIALILAMLPLVAPQVTVKEATTLKQTTLAVEMNGGAMSSDGSAAISLVQIGDDRDFLLTITSTNRYDDPYTISLGHSVESAEKTLLDLMGLFDAFVGDAFSIDTPEPNTGSSARSSHTLVMGTSLGRTEGNNKKPKSMIFAADGYAGEVILHKRAFENLIKHFKFAVKIKKINP